MVAGQRRSGRRRPSSQAASAVETSSTLVSDAVVRWEYSIMGWRSSGGSRWPWQSGQSGQPSPEPETRTTPPRTTAP